MKTVYKEEKEISIPDNLIADLPTQPHPQYHQHSSTIKNEDYSLNYLKYELAGIQIEYFDVKYHRPGIQLREYKDDTLDMVFFIEGILNITHDDNFSETVLPNRNNLCYTAPGKSLTQWRFASEEFKVLIISLPKTLLNGYPRSKSEWLENFLKRLTLGKSVRLYHHCMPISSAMHDIIREITNCSKSETGKWIFLESKIRELLSMQLEQVLKPFGSDGYLNNSEIVKKICATKDFMSANLASRVSLSELAKQVGTNTFTLKKGFKELYGTSVFVYWNTLRMNEAKVLLKGGKLSVGEISEKLGFKSQHHFSSTFKKKFGITPTQMRKP